MNASFCFCKSPKTIAEKPRSNVIVNQCSQNIQKSSRKLHDLLQTCNLAAQTIQSRSCRNYLDRIEFLINYIFTSNTPFIIVLSNTYKLGNHKLATMLTVLNAKILLQDLNMSLESSKVKYKKTWILFNKLELYM